MGNSYLRERMHIYTLGWLEVERRNEVKSVKDLVFVKGVMLKYNYDVKTVRQHLGSLCRAV